MLPENSQVSLSAQQVGEILVREIREIEEYITLLEAFDCLGIDDSTVGESDALKVLQLIIESGRLQLRVTGPSIIKPKALLDPLERNPVPLDADLSPIAHHLSLRQGADREQILIEYVISERGVKTLLPDYVGKHISNLLKVEPTPLTLLDVIEYFGIGSGETSTEEICDLLQRILLSKQIEVTELYTNQVIQVEDCEKVAGDICSHTGEERRQQFKRYKMSQPDPTYDPIAHGWPSP